MAVLTEAQKKASAAPLVRPKVKPSGRNYSKSAVALASKMAGS